MVDSCPACGAPLEADARTCPSCGAAVSETTESFGAVDAPESVASLVGEDIEGPVLVVRKGPEVGERFYIDRPSLSIGRDPSSDIFLNDITVSRAHALLEMRGGEVTISDAGSLNGLYVNGSTVERATLRTGDEVQVGRFQMVFIGGGA